MEISKEDLIILFSAWSGYISDSCWENSPYERQMKEMMNKYGITENELPKCC